MIKRVVLLLCFAAPGIAPAAALPIIIETFLARLAKMPRPGTLFVTGGATLRALCEALGATGLTDRKSTRLNSSH